jgi:protein TonB
MNPILEKSFAALVFENRNRDFGGYFLRKLYKRNILLALGLSIAGFIAVLMIPLLYNKYFLPTTKPKIIHMVEVQLQEIPPVEQIEVPPPPPPVAPKVEVPKIAKVKFLPPKVAPDEEVKQEDTPPTTEELKDVNPGDVTQEGIAGIEKLDEATAETEPTSAIAPEDNKVYAWVEQSAEFVGGIQEFKKYLTNNLKYPKEAEAAQISDFVVVKFVINKDGSITNIQIVKKAGYGMDEEAMRVIQNMPFWIPARQNGSIARQEKSLKIPFVLK